MGKTIIQTIGPLYGEVENGTVFGRPNGSIYVPSANTISIEIEDANKYVRKLTSGFTRFILCSSAGLGRTARIIAESQDVQSYIQTYITDSNGDPVGVPVSYSAGQFNITISKIADFAEGADITAGDTYTLHVVLCSFNGVPVATTLVSLLGVEV